MNPLQKLLSAKGPVYNSGWNNSAPPTKVGSKSLARPDWSQRDQQISAMKKIYEGGKNSGKDLGLKVGS